MPKPTLAAVFAQCALFVACDPVADTVPAGPEELVQVVRKAARDRDYHLLSRHMADEFSYSFGREPSREDAIARYRDEPALLDTLADILARKCALNESDGDAWFVCPAAALDESHAYYGWRAGFRREQDGSWQFVWFIAGD